MLSPVGATSRLVAAARALESESAQPLFHDTYARALAGEEGFAIGRAVASSHIQSQRDSYLAIRTRFIDDLVLNSVAGRGIRQVVLLAAGMDTRAFRFDWPADLQWFEVDRGEIFAQKEPVLAAMAAKQPGCHRTIVIADLEHDWVAPLTAAGFEASRPTLFAIEGLVVYLEPASVEQLMTTVFSVAAAGSGFVADVMNQEMLTSPYTQTVIARFREMGCPWRFATSEPRAYFERFGWRVTINTPDEPAIAHGRWQYPPVPQSVQGIPRTYFVSGWR